MPGISTGDEALDKKILDWFLATPKALAIMVCSYLSGQMWFFILVTYYKNKPKGNIHLNSKIAKTVLGLLWFSIINLPIHWLRNGFEITYDNVFSNYLYALLYGFVIQGIVVILIITLKKEK